MSKRARSRVGGQQWRAFLLASTTALLLALGLLAWLALGAVARIDADAQHAAHDRVVAALAADRAVLGLLARDYAHWTEAHLAVGRADVAWLGENAGSSVYETGTMDLAVYFAPSRGLHVGWSAMVGAEPIDAPLPAAVTDRMIAALLAAEAGGEVSASLILEIDGAHWLIAAARVMPLEEHRTGPRDEFFMFSGRLFHEATVADIARRAGVEDLRHMRSAATSIEHLALDPGAGSLAWALMRPGSAAVASVAPVLAAGAAVALAALLATPLWTAWTVRRLQAARALAQEADRAKAAFIAGASHELRTPLNGVTGVLQLLAAEPLTARQQRLVEIARGSAASQVALIDRLFDVGRLGSGRATLERQPVDAPALLREIVEMMYPLAAAKGVTLNLRAPEQAPRVMMDALALRQIAQNLLANAVKFTDGGGVRARLELTAEGDAVALALVVADDGPGVPPDERERIFLPFAQGRGSSAQGGAGLGLSIVRSLAEMMDGTVTVSEGSGGRGAVFTVALRLARAPDAQVDAAA